MRLKESLVVVREMPPRRGARRGGRGGRGRGAGRVQPEVQPTVQAIDPAAPVTHADLAAMEQRFRDLIMQMREQQQPASPAPAPVPVVPQVVPDQLSAEAKHLRDFRKYNPTTFDGSLEDPTRAQLWLSSLETIFRSLTKPPPPVPSSISLPLANSSISVVVSFTTPAYNRRGRPIFDLPLGLTQPVATVCPSSDRVCRPNRPQSHRVAEQPSTSPNVRASQVDSLSVDSIKGHSQVQVRVQQGTDRRGARRMREGHMDASGFLYASADVFLLLVIFIVRSSHG
ncbi:gag protease polyprotein [Cucumis melo var. makuwa]|uniref:Gag protease polyprotein n=1 Tax=Cucumis melo var. makuwa TaxID=1194695 RepID=A0A5D3BCD0_CUCMM|nr:gag protease polyprotein [Cucumis melo var. makuwa]